MDGFSLFTISMNAADGPPVCLCFCTSVCTTSEFMSCRLHSSVCLSACPSTCVLFLPSVCVLLKVFASAHSRTPSSPRLLPPHLHEGDVVEKRADSGGFKAHLLGSETIDGAKDGAVKQE